MTTAKIFFFFNLKCDITPYLPIIRLEAITKVKFIAYVLINV